MQKLVCLVDLFTFDQTIFMYDDVEKTYTVVSDATFENLSERLADISDVTKINHIELRGARKYVNEIASEVLTYAKTRYNNNDLIVEVT